MGKKQKQKTNLQAPKLQTTLMSYKLNSFWQDSIVDINQYKKCAKKKNLIKCSNSSKNMHQTLHFITTNKQKHT